MRVVEREREFLQASMGTVLVIPAIFVSAWIGAGPLSQSWFSHLYASNGIGSTAGSWNKGCMWSNVFSRAGRAIE